MDYSLALELKEAGYPFKRIENGNHLPPHWEHLDFNPEGDEKLGAQHFYIPTLGELIEACGDKIDDLCRVTMGWRASGTDDTDDPEHPTIRKEEYGETSEESVAKLYLALKKSS